MQIWFRCKHLFSFVSYIECFGVATDNVLSHGNKQQPHVSRCWHWCHGDGTGVLFVENLGHRWRLSVECITGLACYAVYFISYLAVCRWPSAEGHSPLWHHCSLAWEGNMVWWTELPVGIDFLSDESGRSCAPQGSWSAVCQPFYFFLSWAMHIWSQWRWSISHQKFPNVYIHF